MEFENDNDIEITGSRSHLTTSDIRLGRDVRRFRRRGGCDDLPHIRHSHNNSVSPLLFASLKIYKAVPSAIRPGLTLIPGLSRAYLFFISLQCLVYGNDSDLNKSKIQWVWTVVRVVSLLAADRPVC